MVALHSSDPVSVYLSVCARMRAPNFAAVDCALYEDRSLVRFHAMRRTLWVATPDVARAAHASRTLGTWRRERTQLIAQLEVAGIAKDGVKWLRRTEDDAVAWLAANGPSTARALGDAVPALRARLTVGGGAYSAALAAHTRVLLMLGFEGRILRDRPTGTWINGQYRYAVTDEVLPGGLSGMDTSEAQRVLADRYLRAFGPATSTDLAWWAGWTQRAMRTALTEAGAVPVELEDEGEGWVAPGDDEPVAAPEPWIALLPGLDPTTMGWKQREWYLGSHAPTLFDRNGNAGPTVWCDGRVVGGWVQRADGEIAVRVLEPITRAQQRAIDRAARGLRDLLGHVRFTVRFPAPLQTELRATPT